MTKRCLSRTCQSFQKRSIDRGEGGVNGKVSNLSLSKYDSNRSFPTAKLLGKSQERNNRRYSIVYVNSKDKMINSIYIMIYYVVL